MSNTMKIPFVDLKVQYQSIKTEIDEAIQSVIDDTAFINGNYVKEFETNFAQFCQADYCVGVGNGTDALFITLRALGIGAGSIKVVKCYLKRLFVPLSFLLRKLFNKKKQ